MADTTRFSAEDITISPLTESDKVPLSDFYCGVKELDDFFHKEVMLCSKYKYLIPYKCTLSNGLIVGAFTLANDVVSLEYEDKVEFPNLNNEYFDIFTRQTSYPAVNIGHLAVREEFQSKGIGALIVGFVQITFALSRLSGCQFITVDAINNAKTLKFYQDKMGFELQTLTDVAAHTRRMYLDIFTTQIETEI